MAGGSLAAAVQRDRRARSRRSDPRAHRHSHRPSSGLPCNGASGACAPGSPGPVRARPAWPAFGSSLSCGRSSRSPSSGSIGTVHILPPTCERAVKDCGTYRGRSLILVSKEVIVMNSTLFLTPGTRSTAGVLLLTIVAIQYGGWFMLRVVRGQQPATPFQQSFFRAGHAHAGVLVILALVSQILVLGAHIGGLLGSLASNALWVAAILMSAGFFLSSSGRNATTPNGFIVVLYLGAVSLGVGVLSLGFGLLTA